MQEIHPLLINHVVERILEYYAESDSSLLLRVRPVCQVWNQVGSACHRKRSKNYISFGKNFHKITEFNDYLIDKSSGVNVNTFPLANFNLCPDLFQSQNVTFLESFFSGDCSIVLTSLVIRLDIRSTLKFQVGNNLLGSSIQLPRLKKLTFDDARTPSLAFDDIFTILLSTSSQNLESLSIHRKQSHGAEEYRQETENHLQQAGMMRRICDTFTTVSLKNLQNLLIDLAMNADILNCLSHRLVPLQNLSLCLKTSGNSGFSHESGTPSSLQALLESQKNTLVNLRLDGLCEKSQFRIDFPIFSQLQGLQIHGWSHNIPHFEFGLFSYPQNFPALKNLVLDTWSPHPSWRQFLICNNTNDEFNDCSGITRIKLPQEMLELNLISHDMTFSNLKALTLHFQPALFLHSSRLLETVFENLGMLEELVILGSFRKFSTAKCIDPLLTGLDMEECQRMLRVNNFSNVMTSQESNNNGMRRPSLANLKRLKLLDLSDVLKRQAIITDVTGYLLLNMRGLEHLKITQSKMRQNCFHQLYNKFPSDLAKELNHSQDKMNAARNIETFSSLTGSCQIM